MNDGMKLLADVYFGKGWSRVLPDGAISVVGTVADVGPISADGLEHLFKKAGSSEGLDLPVWDPLRAWTDDEIADLDEAFAGTPFDLSDDHRTAEELIAEDLELRSERLAETQSYADHLGVTTPSTLRELLPFLVACRILTLDARGYAINIDAPLPGEMLPLSQEESALQDSMRWSRLHEGFAQRVIALFGPRDELAATSLNTSLRALAQAIDSDPESTRQGVLNLLSDGDFSSPVDVARIGEDDAFDLTVDLETFRKRRFSVTIDPPNDKSEDGDLSDGVF